MTKFQVERTWQAGEVVKKHFDSRTMKKYDAVVEALRHDGCVAGGKRLQATGGGDSSFCQRSLGGKWRMILAFDGDRIVIVEIGEHDGDSGPVATLAEIAPEVAAVGRRRKDQPKCCEDPSDPPQVSERGRELLPH